MQIGNSVMVTEKSGFGGSWERRVVLGYFVGEFSRSRGFWAIWWKLGEKLVVSLFALNAPINASKNTQLPLGRKN